MRNSLSQLSKNEKAQLIHTLSGYLKQGKNLIYYASGRWISEDYYTLPFDHVVLIDRTFRFPFRKKKNVITLGFSAVEATGILQAAGAKFDAFVCINEGLCEGGGYYPINSNWSIGTIMPIMKEEYVHIACPPYYGSGRWKKMFNLPQQARLLGPEDPGYVDPAFFCSCPRYVKESSVWHIRKQAGEPAKFLLGKREIMLQRKNIWDDYAQLDAVFLNFFGEESNSLQQLYPKTQRLWKGHFEDILLFCQKNKIRVLGLTPWMGGKYHRFLNYLKEQEKELPYPYKIQFYHLNKNDFRELYALAS